MASNVRFVDSLKVGQYKGERGPAGSNGSGSSFPFTGSAQITGSLGVTGSIEATNFTGSSFTGSFVGDGSGLINLPNSSSPFPFTGSAQITGSLGVTGSVLVDGNVGIGTISPTTRLSVASPSSDGIVISGHYSSSNTSRFFETGIVANDAYLILRNSGVVSTVKINSDGDSYFNGGNVGIGTTSPTDPLTVTSTSNSTGIRLNYPSTNSTVYPFYVGNEAETSYVRANSNAIAFKRNGGASTIKTEGSSNNLSLESTGNFIVKTGNPINTQMTILTNGNVGIGVTNPDRPLSVVGGNSMVARFQSTNTTSFIQFSNTVSTADQIRLGSNGTSLTLSTNYAERMRILANGNVGIGTTSPQANLDITSALNQQHLYIQGAYGEGSGALARIKTTANGNALLVESATVSDSREIFEVKNLNGSVFSVQGNGNVGIGTTSPTEKLQVTGNISASGDFIGRNFTGSSFTGSFVGDGSGLINLPTGSAQITGSLDVKGNITGSENISASGDFIGRNFTGSNGSFTNSITTPEISGNTEITGDLQVGKITADGSISTTSHITASGNISASGDFIGRNFTGSSFTGSFVGNGNGLITLKATETDLQQSITSNQTVGGISSGETFATGTDVEDILRQILISYIEPTISNLDIKDNSAEISYTRDVGDDFITDEVTFNATQDSPNGNFPENSSLVISNATTGNGTITGPVTLASSNSIPITDRTINRTTDGSVTFRVDTESQTTSDTQSTTKSINFRWRNYLLATSVIINDTAKLSAAFTSNVVQSPLDTNKGWTATCNADNANTNNFTYIVYPSSYGDLTGIIQNGATPVLGAFTKSTDITANNSSGISQTWRIYKSNIPGAFASGVILTIS